LKFILAKKLVVMNGRGRDKSQGVELLFDPGGWGFLLFC
jgi:hypothetical protein